MKIAIASDLHLEFGDLLIKNEDNADVLILGGDILVVEDLRARESANITGEATKSQRYHEFMLRCSFQFPHVIYILGNHEHYHGNFSSSTRKLREYFAHLPNVYILDRETKVIDDVVFIGGTLWSDMNKSDSLTLFNMRSMMNDFRVIWYGNKNRKFGPGDAVDEHLKMKNYISAVVEGKHDQKFVVVGHHAPSRSSIHEMYQNDTIMNGGFSSDMDEFILDRPQIRLWTHGHTHHDFDYTIGSTRVVCNPRGYMGYEAQADVWKLKTVDI